MYEITVTYKRRNTSVDFFSFQTQDVGNAIIQLSFRNDMINDLGFLGMSYVMSEDKLTMKMIVLWKSVESANEFVSIWKHQFEVVSKGYHRKNDIKIYVNSQHLPDTQKIKYEKISTRMYAEEAGKELREFISSSNDSN